MSSRITPRAIRSLTNTTTSPAIRQQLKATASKLEAAPSTRSSSTTTRPTAPSPSALPTLRPLMQGFHTTTSTPAPSAAPSIDYIFLPTSDAISPPSVSALRVPLLPDNYTPDRSVGSAHAPELPVTPLLRSEISVVAGRPETVVASALTEVVGLGREMGLGELTRAFKEGAERVEGEVVGGLRGLWGDLLDDVLGEKAVKVVRA